MTDTTRACFYSIFSLSAFRLTAQPIRVRNRVIPHRSVEGPLSNDGQRIGHHELWFGILRSESNDVLSQLSRTKRIVQLQGHRCFDHQIINSANQVSHTLGLLQWAFPVKVQRVAVKPAKVLRIDIPDRAFDTAIVVSQIVEFGKPFRKSGILDQLVGRKKLLGTFKSLVMDP